MTDSAKPSLSPLPSPVCTIQQAAGALLVTRQTIYSLVHAGRLHLFKIGAASRLRTADVLALIGGDTASLEDVQTTDSSPQHGRGTS